VPVLLPTLPGPEGLREELAALRKEIVPRRKKAGSLLGPNHAAAVAFFQRVI